MDTFRREQFGVPTYVQKFYLFHGIPDVYLINQRPSIIKCGAVVDEAIVPHDSGLPSSSAGLGLGLELDSLDTRPTTSDSANCDTGAGLVFIGEAAKGKLPCSYPYSKMGELLANMNCSHNDQILHQFLTAQDYKIKPFVITGLFFHKETGKFEMELKTDSHSENLTVFAYHIDHSIVPIQLLDESLLCASLREYAGIDLHTS